jgi:hypothetical protein
MEHSVLVTIPEFRRLEPAFKSDQSVYLAAREVPAFPVVRIGRRLFIDLERWAEFKRAGGAVLAGGWRRQAPGGGGPAAQPIAAPAAA